MCRSVSQLVLWLQLRRRVRTITRRARTGRWTGSAGTTPTSWEKTASHPAGPAPRSTVRQPHVLQSINTDSSSSKVYNEISKNILYMYYDEV